MPYGAILMVIALLMLMEPHMSGTILVLAGGASVLFAAGISLESGRGATILRGVGAGSGKKKEVVICACDNKQIHRIKRAVHERDPRAFAIILESGEVVGEGFSRAN